MKNRLIHRAFAIKRILAVALLFLLPACSHNYSFSVNNQAVFDPTGRLSNAELADPVLQGCVNIAIQQQNVQNLESLRVLSCGNSEVKTLKNIEKLAQLRFLDLSNNRIRELSSLTGLSLLGGLNLMNNAIVDTSPLLQMANLVSVNLVGNYNIPCQQLRTLKDRLGNNLNPPESCRN